jgi:endonuclease-3
MSAVPSPTSFPPDPKRVAELFERFERLNPQPKTELSFKDPYTLVVAVALSAQATDKAVNKATDKLFEIADTPRKMLDLGVEGLMPLISSIGLYRNKAKNVIALSQIVVEKHGGEVPLEREALQALPGVGRKTASVVLNELGVEPAIAVDTHVFRVSHRLGLANASTPDKVERQLFEVVPKKWLGRAHHWLILHGRYICTAQKPKCHACPVSDLCPWYQAHTSASARSVGGSGARTRSKV